MRATRHPTYYDFNLVRVEEDPAMSVEALVAVADEALAGLEHRRFDFDVVAVADALRPGFEALGWKTHAPGVDAPRVPAAARPRHRGAEVPYDAVHELRVAWHGEDSPDQDTATTTRRRARSR